MLNSTPEAFGHFLSWRAERTLYLERHRPPEPNLQRADNMHRGGGCSPPANQNKSARDIAKREGRGEDPNIDIAPAADAADEAIDIRDVIQVAAHFLFHHSFRE